MKENLDIYYFGDTVCDLHPKAFGHRRCESGYPRYYEVNVDFYVMHYIVSGKGVFEKNATAAQAIGYKEILPYLRGSVGLDEAAETLKMATRRYAKRQITWFSAKPYVNWIDLQDTDKKTFEEIVNNAENLFKNQ